MKLVSVYTNKDEIFPPISLHPTFNVVFAKVKRAALNSADSHNLGKTFLISVIDFCLLAKITKVHPFKKAADLFSDFVFFLQVQAPSGKFITIRRPVSGRAAIAIMESTEPRSLRESLNDSWSYSDLSIEDARSILNRLLDLQAIKPYPYRKGLGYFLRSQADYSDVFQISKFGRGSDIDWKPYLALLFGYDYELFIRKYELQRELTAIENAIAQLEDDGGVSVAKADEFRARMELLERDIERHTSQLNAFSFRELEAEISNTLVSNVEQQISNLNDERYKLDVQIREIENSLEVKLQFNLKKIDKIFAEAQLAFPDGLKRNYEDLVELNRKLGEARHERLSATLEEFKRSRENLNKEFIRLDELRVKSLEALKNRETLEKYKSLQSRIFEMERRRSEIAVSIEKLNVVQNLNEQRLQMVLKIAELSPEINKDILMGNTTFNEIRKNFSAFVEAVFGLDAFISVALNGNDNIDFKIKTISSDDSTRETSADQGTSYRKMLCVCFDLAVLCTYSKANFYHFVYHDGVFEGLDNRKKVKLLQLIRSLCKQSDIQYILTVIDSDLPRNDEDEKLLFTQDEIVRELSDDGPKGRLFRMREF